MQTMRIRIRNTWKNKKQEHGKRRKLLGEKTAETQKTKSQEKLMISPWAETRGKLLHWDEKGKHEPQPNELDHYQTSSEVDEIGEGATTPLPPTPPF